MAVARKDVGDVLVEKGFLSATDLAEARKAQKAAMSPDLGRVLVDLKLADEKDVVEAKATVLGKPFVDLNTRKPDPAAISLVSQTICQRHNLIPLQKAGNTIFVAVSDPSNVLAMDDVRLATGCRVEFALAVPSAVEDAISRNYSGATAMPSGPAAGSNGNSLGESVNIAAEIEKYKGNNASIPDERAVEEVNENTAPIIRVANTIIQQAIEAGASDIHVEPTNRGVRIRYRVDGVLHEVMPLPRYIHPPLSSRYKIMADMNIAERRVPQDGSIQLVYKNKEYDLRVNCLPTKLGEKLVMRILDKSSVLIGLNKLGFDAETQAQLDSVVTQPNGMILTSGPTGSGKTTTQYSILNKLNTIEKNILTVENPVEYQLPGISQVQVNTKAGLTFPLALRAFLRQDPDIIMVGEIRDLETAEIAVESALTGHMVLSTIHTNDAPSAVTRLVDMGIEPFLISATVIAVLAQRLARTICSNCRMSHEVPIEYLRRFGYKPKDGSPAVTLWKGRGCEICKQTGFKGRTGIYEMMLINDEVNDLIVRRAPLADIREAARANGMQLLRENGLRKVLEGITTPEEVMRVVFTAGHA